MLCDTDEQPAQDRRQLVIALARGTTLALVRNGPRNFTLTYDPAYPEAATAALIAIAAQAGMPVCGDVASLAMMTLAQRVAQSEIPVLIEGPTGTGKEVLSRYIHAASKRGGSQSASLQSAGPFIAVNCAAMPETMLEALLFGHRKGAYTGATEASEGFFRAADGGTLLLDEIGELPLALQSKLLRTLQEGEVVPLGQAKPVKVDVRIIACTNRNLPDEVAQGRFRADLYYRLNVFPLQMEALRTRPGDIAPLVFAMIMRHANAAGAGAATIPTLSVPALQKLALHPWPGNVRELENVIRRALLLLGDEPQIQADHISFDRPVRAVVAELPPGQPHLPFAAQPVQPAARQTSSDRLSDIARHSEAEAILDTLDQCSGHRGATARQLGISERTLRYRMADMRTAGLLTAGARA